MEYFNNTLCVSGATLIMRDGNPDGLISKSLWDKWVKNGANVVRRACNGQTALIDYNSIPQKYRDMIAAKYGAPSEQAKVKPFKDKIVTDGKAVTFYSNYQLADGRSLPTETQREYAINAAVLNAIKEVYTNAKETRSKLGASMVKFWANAIVAVNSVRADFNHTLPSTSVTLSRKYAKYLNEGYAGLISGKYCNDNSRKVSDKIENLIMSLYTMPNKPFASTVHTLYQLFLAGAIQVADQKSGELFNPTDFHDQAGEPISISETTVWNYLNQPANRVIVDKVRMGGHRFNSTQRPHHHRSAPQFSFSKISMDDRDLPRKCVNGKYVKAYYAYDVTSGCVIGYAYSDRKNEELFLDCMRNMFRLIDRERFGMPLEVEVENHLVNKFFDDLAVMFPFVRVCNPGNSQEKRAEHFNRAKKYGAEKLTQTNIGRWWSRHEAYQVDRDKKGDEFVDKVVLPYDRLVADDEQSIITYNNQLHPKQQKYPGKTRWQVLVENMNPNAATVAKPVVYKAIGEKADTSINRNQYVTVRAGKYQIPHISILNRLEPGNFSVTAYFLPDQQGLIDEVYLYHKGEYLCKADKLITYNESKAERTQQDLEAYKKQSEFVAQFDAKAKAGKNELASAVIIESKVLKEALATPVEIVPPAPEEDNSFQQILRSDEVPYTEEDAANDL